MRAGVVVVVREVCDCDPSRTDTTGRVRRGAAQISEAGLGLLRKMETEPTRVQAWSVGWLVEGFAGFALSKQDDAAGDQRGQALGALRRLMLALWMA